MVEEMVHTKYNEPENDNFWLVFFCLRLNYA